MPAGRPQKNWDDFKKTLPEDWLEQLTELAECGKVELHFRHKFREWVTFSNDLWARFKQDEKEFSDTLKDLLEISAIWWFDKIQSSIDKGKECNATALIFGASNAHKHHFRRNTEFTQEDKKDIVEILSFGQTQMKIKE